MKKNKQKLHLVMIWFILLTLVNYFIDPEVKNIITKIMLSISGLFAVYILLIKKQN